MKHLKMLMLVAVATGALMALFGVGTAAAAEEHGTTICKEELTPCPAAKHYPAGTVYHFSLKEGTEATLAAGFSEIKCKESKVTLEQTNTGGKEGESVTGNITALSFGNCNATVNVLSLGSGKVTWKEAFSGSLTGSGTKVEIVAGTTKCFYGGEITEGLNVKGGAPATATATNVKLARETGSSALCANPSKWNASYVANTTNQNAWVSHS
jgi:hypothetical protein